MTSPFERLNRRQMRRDRWKERRAVMIFSATFLATLAITHITYTTLLHHICVVGC